MTITDTTGDEDMDEDYVNEDCPNECSVEHDVPSTSYAWRHGTEMRCPENGYRYRVCYSCEEWTDVDYGRYPYGYDDWYCDSCAEDLDCRCDECMYEDDDYDGGARDDGPEYVSTSRCCTTQNVHMDLLTEQFVCECKARALLDNGGVVLLAYPLPAVAVAA